MRAAASAFAVALVMAVMTSCGGGGETEGPAIATLDAGPDRVVAVYEGQAEYAAALAADPDADATKLFRELVIAPYWDACFAGSRLAADDLAAHLALRDADRLAGATAALSEAAALELVGAERRAAAASSKPAPPRCA